MGVERLGVGLKREEQLCTWHDPKKKSPFQCICVSLQYHFIHVSQIRRACFSSHELTPGHSIILQLHG